MKKLSKKVIRQIARNSIINVIHKEIDNPSELIQQEDFPALNSEEFDTVLWAIYDEMEKICNSLNKRWKS